MSTPSTVERLDPRVREEIAIQRAAGHTIDEILSAIRELGAADVSRSALGRHIKKMDKVTRQMRESRNVAEALVRQYGDAPASRTARANIELLHSVVLNLFTAEDGELDTDGLAALKGNPEGVMMLAKSLDHLGRASKSDVDYAATLEAQIEKRLRSENDKAIRAVAKERGWDAETVQAIQARILGVKK